LSEISHKRRITALGPSGLDRSRARIEVRDVDPSHYGRICPIETPEGANIGLVMSLALFSRLNIYGFLVTPYRVVKNREITDKTEYLDFAKEKTKVIASWTKDLLENNKIAKDTVMARVGGEVVMVKSDTVEYIDFSPRQLISISAGLIPFLETDEAARALMGSNMQRQAFPLIKPTPPLVGTGLEAEFMKYTNSVVKAKRPGVVSLLLPNKIFITGFNKETFEKYVDFYDLKKFDKTNQNTLISQSPIVELGQEVKAGQVISDGQSSDGEELALGRNVLVGFMTWNGYNYEDSIILSEKLVIEEKFDSIHIEEYAIDVKDTRLGAEEVTREIPNISDGSLKLLDESGIVKEGVFVRPGDVLVGKVTPKTQDLLTPEERLLKAIFGERGSEVTDSSLIVKPGTSGTVIGVKIISRRGVEKLSRAMQEEERNILQLSNENSLKIQKITDLYNDVCDIILENQDVIMTKAVKNANQSLATKAFLNSLSLTAKFELKMSDLAVETKLLNLKEEYNALIKKCKEEYENTINNLYVGDDLPQGVLMTIKVYLAIKRIIQPGDKMAGRHGNKGVVSKIVPIEDMPYLKDGTPLDILLSPLGIPQRMNVGQVFETHLGLVGREIGRKIQKMLEQKKMEDDIRTMIKDVLASDRMSEVLDNLSMDELKYAISKWSQDGVRFACPSFDSISSDEIFAILERLGYDKSGQVEVYDGYTGEKVDRKVTIGYVYVLKLHHIVEEKVHARSVGSYSLITQQPLGGRSNFGGQRFGEMECWALQAYGAAYTLQEILTVKSDDVTGRSKMYEAILRGDSNFTYNVPESFNVLVRQLRSLCLNIEVAESNEILNN
jgi:DNA-directed RNA polymerase subunit beta